jgi:excisionase family DNA binding protein
LAQAFERRRADLEQAAQDYYVRHLIDREQFLAVRDGVDRDLVHEHQELLPLRVRETLKRLGRRSPRAAWDSFDIGQRREMLGAVLDHVVVDPAPRNEVLSGTGRDCVAGQGSVRPTATRAVPPPKRRRTRPGETFSTKQAADYLGLSTVYVASLIRRGELDATRGNHGWEITQTAIDVFLEERRLRPRRLVAP